tara:strand:+ start:124 stop:504 length:381 start_codon:yes stop_codon:yes gene_type:complete
MKEGNVVAPVEPKKGTDSQCEISSKYPSTYEEFTKINDQMLELFCDKQADYGPTNIGMGNAVVDTDEDVKRSLLGLSVRMNDKVQRLLNITLNDRKPNNESVEDTLMDLANYSVMALIVMRKVWGK